MADDANTPLEGEQADGPLYRLGEGLIRFRFPITITVAILTGSLVDVALVGNGVAVAIGRSPLGDIEGVRYAVAVAIVECGGAVSCEGSHGDRDPDHPPSGCDPHGGSPRTC